MNQLKNFLCACFWQFFMFTPAPALDLDFIYHIGNNYFSFPSLACHGLRHWNRVFLIPWLTFYLLILGIVTTCLLQALYSHNFLLQWRHIFLFFAIFTIFYCWSHVKKQYIMMTLPRPDQVPRPHLSRALCVMTYVLCVYVVSLCDDASLFYYGF